MNVLQMLIIYLFNGSMKIYFEKLYVKIKYVKFEDKMLIIT